MRTRSLWVCIAVLAVVEMIVRIAVPNGLTPRGGFHNAEMRMQVSAFTEQRKLDLLFIGSSVAAVNFSPVDFDAEMEQLGYPDFSSFNAGIRGCNYACIARGVQRYYLTEPLPQFAILVISPEDLDMDNRTVMRRSGEFIETFEEPAVRVFIRNQLSKISYIYGLQSHLRSVLTLDGWSMDKSVVRTRGYVDMGADPRRRHNNSPVVAWESSLNSDLSKLVGSLAERGVAVLLVPAEGDSAARSLITRGSMSNYYALLDSLGSMENVSLMSSDGYQFEDAEYIDNLHLSTSAARLNSIMTAREFVNHSLN